MMNYDEFVKRLREISELQWVKSHRNGPTGVGKTLEDLLDIHENNIAGPDHVMFELKSARKNSQSMLTLFTKSPLPKRANALLLEKYGYPSAKGNGRKELHTTIRATGMNTLKDADGFAVGILSNRIVILSAEGLEIGYWDKETLRSAFEKKYPGLVYVLADARSKGADEEFWYNEAYFLSGFDFANFIRLVKEGVVVIDIRIGQYPNGKPHDHGTGFRVLPSKLDDCFVKRIKIL